MTNKNDKPVVHFVVLQSVEDYVDKSGKFRTECTSFKIPGQDSGIATALYIPYCEKQRFDFGPTLNDYRANGVFTPPEMGKRIEIMDFAVYREHFHDIHCPQPCRGYVDKRVVASEKPAPHVSKQIADSSAGKWTRKEKLNLIVPIVAGVLLVVVGAILAWITPEGRRWLHLDKPQPEQRVQSPTGKPGTTEVLPPATDKVDVTVKRAPTQTVTATVGHPKQRLRTKLGDLITEGTKIRDIAPVYVGDPIRVNGEPDVMAEWKAWTAKVEQFLNANFDSAEVAKFRSRDDPNTSLNSKIHFEIAYLEQLLDRVGQDSQVPTMNSAPGGIVNNGGVINNPTINNGASPPKTAPTPEPDLGVEFVSPQDVAFRMVNLSDAIVRDPKYSFVLVDLDAPRTVGSGDSAIPQILQIPTAVNSGDFLKSRQKYMQRPMSTFQGVQAIVKPGDRIFGYVTVTCPDCIKERRYWLYYVNGPGGWYSEFTGGGEAVKFPIGGVLTDTDKTLAQIAPAAKRIPISGLN